MAPPEVAPEEKGRGRRGNRRFPYPEVAPDKEGVVGETMGFPTPKI